MTAFSASAQFPEVGVYIAKVGREPQHQNSKEMTRHDHV
jgi:hypothetical protein